MKKEAQKKYKDTVFRLLFKDPKNALSLYNGLSGTDYTDPTLLEYNTLENAIYMNLKNDLSFVIAHQMHLYENQSTVNPNMPLRDLLYVTDIIQKRLKSKSLYESKLVQIPTPFFVVFYNGTQVMPEQLELKLSDAYEHCTEMPSLELKVTVLNINKGMNEELKERCPVLREYMQYVEKVRDYANSMELIDAVEQAVDECIAENILKDFLLAQKAEVTMVSIYEYDEERELRRIRESEREIGEEIGKEIGMELGQQRGVVSTCLSLGLTKEETIEKLIEICHITRGEAEEVAQTI